MLTYNVHVTFLHYRELSSAMCGPEKDLGMLALKAPGNSPTVSSSPGKKKTARVREREGGRGGGKEKGRRGGAAGGVLTTDKMLSATSIELVCTCTSTIHVCALLYMYVHEFSIMLTYLKALAVYELYMFYIQREVQQCSSKPGCVEIAREITSQLSPHQLSLITISESMLQN